MKITVVINDKKLKRIMQLKGIKTKKAAIDFALDEAERNVALEQIMSEDLYISSSKQVIDKKYDILKMRNLEKPV